MPKDITLDDLPREIASDDTVIPRELAEEDRVFTEKEHVAIMANVVATETASLRQANEVLEAQVATLNTEKAAAEQAREVAEAATATAQTELADHKAEIEKAAELVALGETRTAKMREVASHLPAEYFTAEKAEGWAKLDETSFASLSEAIAQTAPAGGAREVATVTTTIVGAPAGVPKAADARALAQTVLGQNR